MRDRDAEWWRKTGEEICIAIASAAGVIVAALAIAGAIRWVTM